MSTAAQVRDKLVDTLQTIAQTKLGFDDPDGNIKDYLLEHEMQQLYGAYLYADADAGQSVIRAWGVSVFPFDVPYALGNVSQRTFEIRVEGYYDLETEGAGVNKLLDHANEVQKVINALTPTLGLGLRISSFTVGFPDVIESGVSDVVKLLKLRMSITALQEGVFV